MVVAKEFGRGSFETKKEEALENAEHAE